jgi:hypothetical protein
MTLDTRLALFAVLHESDSDTLERCCDFRHSKWMDNFRNQLMRNGPFKRQRRTPRPQFPLE